MSLKTHLNENPVFGIFNMVLWHVSEDRGHIKKVYIKIAFLYSDCWEPGDQNI